MRQAALYLCSGAGPFQMSQFRPLGGSLSGTTRAVAPGRLLVVDPAEVNLAELAVRDVLLGRHVVRRAAVLEPHWTIRLYFRAASIIFWPSQQLCVGGFST